MSDMAGIAGNAVAVYQQALTTVSNNIANVATDGYSRQDVKLSALPVTLTGGVFLGSGVMVDRVQRQYNEFVERNLRNTVSDLASQEPMVSYANRVVDIMGGESMGLSSALDRFFEAARALSGDASSTVMRGSFMREAEGVGERFGQLSAQLDLVDLETRQTMDSSVSQINELAANLALVNKQLTKQRTQEAQPPDLLDQRDLLLKKLSSFAHVNTEFTPNGTVTVSLGATIGQDVLVRGNNALMVQANYDTKAPDKVVLVLDPYGQPRSLSGITSGSLAGLMSFREQVLGSTRNALDGLAQTFAKEANTVHQQGVDGYGNPGQALFKFDPKAANAAAGIQVAFADAMLIASAAQFRVVKGATNPSDSNASISYLEGPPAPQRGPADITTALVNGAYTSAVKNINVSLSVPFSGVAAVANGMTDLSVYLNAPQAGQQLAVMTRDGRQLIGKSMASDSALLGQLMTPDNGFAAGATYSDAYLNGVSGTSPSYKAMSVFYGAQATVQQQPIYNAKDQISGYKAFPAMLQGDRLQGGNSGIAANTLVLNGVALEALAAPSSGTLQPSAVAAWLNSQTAKTGVTATASNEIRLNPGQIKYGLPLYINGERVDASQTTTLAGMVAAINQASGSGVTARVASDGQLLITGMPGRETDDITVSTGTTVGLASQNALGVAAGTYRGQVSLTRATADLVTVNPAKLDFTKSLFINGKSITTTASTATGINYPADSTGVALKTTGATTILALANAINATPDVNISARVSASGQLVLSNRAGQESASITISASPDPGSSATNALGTLGPLDPDTLKIGPITAAKNQVINHSPIQLGFGSNGTPADLARLGFRTGVFVAGAVKDDLLVFVTGAGNTSVSASYSGKAVDAKQNLRAQSLQVAFSNETDPSDPTKTLAYSITSTDPLTLAKTVVAKRFFNSQKLNPGVEFQGLQLAFSSAPKQGDVFVLDGNRDGIGNNDNMLQLVALEKKAVVGNKTLANAYIDHINEMGNIAIAAGIAQTALTVVHDQAVGARDDLAGVSLDKEATDLIRYQQAYQAAAKSLQIASQLFDSVLQIG
jgi:flagellar hook-associated protein FlgK